MVRIKYVSATKIQSSNHSPPKQTIMNNVYGCKIQLKKSFRFGPLCERENENIYSLNTFLNGPFAVLQIYGYKVLIHHHLQVIFSPPRCVFIHFMQCRPSKKPFSLASFPLGKGGSTCYKFILGSAVSLFS